MATPTTTFIRILHQTLTKRVTSIPTRGIVTNESGGMLSAPEKKGIRGIAGVFLAVGTGITIGSALSRDIANFLEENDLFVPEDDDD